MCTGHPPSLHKFKFKTILFQIVFDGSSLDHVREVRLNPRTKKLLVMVEEGKGGGFQLEQMPRPDGGKMTQVDTGERVKGKDFFYF